MVFPKTWNKVAVTIFNSMPWCLTIEVLMNILRPCGQYPHILCCVGCQTQSNSPATKMVWGKGKCKGISSSHISYKYCQQLYPEGKKKLCRNGKGDQLEQCPAIRFALHRSLLSAHNFCSRLRRQYSWQLLWTECQGQLFSHQESESLQPTCCLMPDAG